MSIITDTELIKARLNDNIYTKMDVIDDLVNEKDNTYALQAYRYYDNAADIKNRKIYDIDENGNKFIDIKATNEASKSSHNYHQILVDQKVQYLFANQFTLSDDDTASNTIDKIKKEINLKDFNVLLSEIGIDASNTGESYLHPYIDAKGNFNYIHVPYTQSIPIYSPQEPDKLDAFIRYYPGYDNGDSVTFLEFWDDKNVEYYIKNDQGVSPNPQYENHIQPHFYNAFDNTGDSWDLGVPFIQFKNNYRKTSDLKLYKDLIDSYNLTIAEFEDNVKEFQEVLYAVKGAGNATPYQLRSQIKKSKIIKLKGDETGIDVVQIDIPVDARKFSSQTSQSNIFKLGGGVDVTKEDFGNNSGVALKFIYYLLDIKASKMEAYFNKGLNLFFDFLIEHINRKESLVIDNTLTVTLNRRMISNDSELAKIAVDSVDILDKETIIKNHPWGDDPERIMAAKEIEDNNSFGLE